MLSNPTAAVLLATYNGEKFLTQQLDSILSQTYENIKIYISDDKSSDSTAEILASYQKKFPKKVFYSINENNVGYVKNFEKLLNNCNEEYMALSDQDDIWMPEKLELQMQEMLSLEDAYNDGACLIHSDLFMIDVNEMLIQKSYFQYRGYAIKPEKDLGHILGPCGVMGNTILLNKKLKELILPFPDSLDLHDYWIGVNAELFGCRKTLFSQLVKYRIHQNNACNSKEALQRKQHSFIDRDIRLPNLETKRKYFLPKLREKIQDKEDLKVFDAYIEYLNFQPNRLKIYINLIKYSLVKRDVWFRMKLFFKILFTNRYR